MRKATCVVFLGVLLSATAMQLQAQNSNNSQGPQAGNSQGQMPPGHGIKCLKPNGTPCGNPEISDLNKDISDIKAAVSDAKSNANDAQQNVSDARQVAGDAKQVGSDAKQPVSNAGQGVGDAQQTASDAKSAYGDAQQTKSDAQQTGQDIQQGAQDVKQTVKDLFGIKSLALADNAGAMNCAQNDNSACNDLQTRALQIHAAQKTPPLTIQREVDQASN
jgi:hypothetical protein